MMWPLVAGLLACVPAQTPPSSPPSKADPDAPVLASPPDAPAPPPEDTGTPGQPPSPGLSREPMTGPAFDCEVSDTFGGGELGIFSRVDVDLNAAPNAVCNDGSGAVYYIRPGSDRWVVYLEGGSHCNSFGTCRDRWCDGIDAYDRRDMSNVGAPATLPLAGLLSSSAANTFSTWTAVYVHYCSSDVWSGSRGAPVLLRDTSDTGQASDYTIRWEGRSILDAVVAELLATNRRPELSALPPAASITTFLLAGGSAGGMGATQAVDDVAVSVRAASPAADVRLATFGAVSPGVHGAFDPWRVATFAPIEEHLRRLMGEGALSEETYGPRHYAARLDASCVANNPYNSWICADIGHVLSHSLSTPFFIVQDQIDSVWVPSVDGILDGGDGPYEGQVTTERFALLVRTFLDALDDIRLPKNPSVYPVDGPAPGGFSPRCAAHDGYGRNNAKFREWRASLLDVGDTGATATVETTLSHWIDGTPGQRAWARPDRVPDCGDTADTGF